MSESSTDAMQVWYGGKLVGRLDNYRHDCSGRHVSLQIYSPEFAEPNEIFDMSDEGVVEQQTFPIRMARFGISKQEISDLGEKRANQLITRLVPPYAEKLLRTDKDVYSYIWRAVHLTEFAEYEWIFDHPDFVPIDTLPHIDPDQTVIVTEPITVGEDMWRTAEEKRLFQTKFDKLNEIDAMWANDPNHISDALGRITSISSKTFDLTGTPSSPTPSALFFPASDYKK